MSSRAKGVSARRFLSRRPPLLRALPPPRAPPSRRNRRAEAQADPRLVSSHNQAGPVPSSRRTGASPPKRSGLRGCPSRQLIHHLKDCFDLDGDVLPGSATIPHGAGGAGFAGGPPKIFGPIQVGRKAVDHPWAGRRKSGVQFTPSPGTFTKPYDLCQASRAYL